MNFLKKKILKAKIPKESDVVGRLKNCEQGILHALDLVISMQKDRPKKEDLVLAVIKEFKNMDKLHKDVKFNPITG